MAAVASLLVAGCHGAATDGPSDVVRLAIHQDPIAFLPLRVADALGYFTEQGLTVDISETVGGTKAMQALLGGSVDVAAATMSDALLLAAEGRDVRGFLLLYSRPTAALAVATPLRGTITSIADLKGRTVGVTAIGSTSHQILNALLANHGLTPDDVSTVAVGMAASSVAALEHGTVAAAVILGSAIPVVEQRSPGALLVDLRTRDGAQQALGSDQFPGVGLIAADRWLREHAGVARRFTLAVTRGMAWVRTHSAEEVRERLDERARMEPETDLRAIRQMQSVLSPDGRLPDAALGVVETLLRASNPKVARATIDHARLFTNDFIVPK